MRARQSQISWFGEEVLNARVEIGDHGVKMGQVEHKDCEDFRGWSGQTTGRRYATVICTSVPERKLSARIRPIA